MNKRQISNISIKGYKSIKETKVNLGQINILIGSNGAGKSNFISSFSMLDNIVNEELQLHIALSGGPNALLHNGPKITPKMEFEFLFGNNGYGFKLIPTNDNKLIFEDEYFNWNYKGDFSLDKGHLESKWKKGLHNDIDKYVKPVLENQMWRTYHFHDTTEHARVKQSHKISDNRKLHSDASNLAAFLLMLRENYKSSYDDIITRIQLVAPYFKDFILESLNKEDIVLRWIQVGSENVLNINQLSDGTLRFICCTVLLSQPYELMPETIIIDEPELGLHPFAITMLSQLIKKVSNKKQIILATQSIDLINQFEVEDIIVVDRNLEGATTFKRLKENELEDWLEDYTLGEIWQKNVFGGNLTR